jgi:hypothetical protein
MRRGCKKDHSELQRHHDLPLHKSRRNPLAYYQTSLEDISETARGYWEMARVAEADATHSREAFVGVQNQVGPLQV